MKNSSSRRGRLNLIYSDNGNTIQKVGVIVENERPYRLAVEAWALSQARKNGVRVPRVLDYHRNKKGQEVLTLERINGQNLEKVNDEIIRKQCILQIGEQLRLLDGISSGYGWITSPSFCGAYSSWCAFLFAYFCKYAGKIVEARLLYDELFQKLLGAFNATDLELASPSLVHRDLKWGNFILDDEGNVWIVDWENAILGDPLYDLALFGIRDDHGMFWKKLAQGTRLNATSRRYIIYEAIALIGVIDFHYKYSYGMKNKLRDLQMLIEQL